MALEAVSDSIQPCEAHTVGKTRLNDMHDRPILQESNDEYSFDSSSGEYAKNEHESKDTLFGV